ncbi:MAG: RNA polymerase sigma-70 factor [Ferruginibacter sp.]
MDPDNIRTFTISAYEKLFMTHYKALTLTSYRLHMDTNAAEDIVQEVFCKLWQKKEQLQITTSLKSYLFRMVINESLNYLKKTKAQHNRETLYSTYLDNEEDTTTNEMNLKETGKRIEQAISSLPPTCKLVFVLNRYEQFSYKQIATELNISVKAVEGHITKALKILRNMLGWLLFLKLFL